MLTTPGNNGQNAQESLNKLAGALQAANRNSLGLQPALNMMEISSVKPQLTTVGGMISSDINALKDMIWDDEEENNIH
jgi:hypothetical protein